MNLSKRKHIVLVGAGHAHLLLCKQASSFYAQHINVTLIDPGNFWYSGMATGMLGGQYQPNQDSFDPHAFIHHQHGRGIRDSVIGLDRSAHHVLLQSGNKICYDAISLNVGSVVNQLGFESTSNVWPIKPIRNLWNLRQCLERNFQEQRGRALSRIIVLGGGPSGCEIAANIAGLARKHYAEIDIKLFTRGDRLLSNLRPEIHSIMQRVLLKSGVEVFCSSNVKTIADNKISFMDSSEYPFDHLVLATGLEPNPAVFSLGLPCNDDGLLVNDQLQSLEDEKVFGAGDCIAFDSQRLPKLGLYAVRQTPVLAKNLIASVYNKPLVAYTPQDRTLFILNCGNRKGLACWGDYYWYGRLSMMLKHWLDSRFMNQFL